MQNDEYILNLISQYDNKEEILEEFHKLSPADEIEALANLIGYTSIPVDIETFVKDDYYLGNIYGESLFPIWLERLKQVFPDPIRTASTFIAAKGCIGCFLPGTIVHTVEYGKIEIQKLAELGAKNIKVLCRVKNKEVNWAYFSHAEECKLTRYVKSYCSITINDSKVNCTLEHPFLMEDGTYKEASRLRIGDGILGYDSEGDGIYLVEGIEFIESDENIPVYDLVNVKDYHNYPICIGDGCIFVHNSGKSTFSLITLAYDYYKMSLIEDLCKFLQLAPTTSFTVRFYNVNIPKAVEVFINPLNTKIFECPYFKELHRRVGGHAHGIKFLPASQPRHALSECLLDATLSEVNFFRPGVAESIIENVTSRLESRLQMGVGFLPHIILDSSDTVEDSAVENYIKNSPYSSEFLIFTTSIWNAKPAMYWHKGSFRVYAGDSEMAPFIFDENNPIDESQLDKDRIIVCPDEVRSAFEQNIELALQEKVGISVKSTNNFIIDKEKIKSKFDLDMVTDEEIVVDFYDSESIWSVLGERILQVLPVERRLYIRLDLGISHDMAGFAIVYFDGLRFTPDKDKSVSTFKVPVAFDISRVKGQETPINKIRDFVFDIAKHREIALISTDSFQSSQLRQEWKQGGLNVTMLSVDRSDVPYNTFKNLMMEDRVRLCANLKLRKEILDLKRIGKKIDHTSAGINCKDTADAVCGAVFSAYNANKDAATPSKFERAKILASVTQDLRILRKDREVGKLNNRNFW